MASEYKVFAFMRQSLLISLETMQYLFCDLILVSDGACMAYYAEALLGKYGECNLHCITCKMSQVVELFSIGN